MSLEIGKKYTVTLLSYRNITGTFIGESLLGLQFDLRPRFGTVTLKPEYIRTIHEKAPGVQSDAK